MSKPATDFGDPQAETKLACDWLIAQADTPDSFASVTPTTRLPGARPTSDLLTVRQQPTWPVYQPPALAVARVRVVAWSLDEDRAWDVATWFHGRLLALSLPAAQTRVRFWRYDAGPAKGIDPDYDTPIAAFTILATMRPALI